MLKTTILFLIKYKYQFSIDPWNKQSGTYSSSFFQVWNLLISMEDLLRRNEGGRLALAGRFFWVPRIGLRHTMLSTCREMSDWSRLNSSTIMDIQKRKC